ncbi:MAG: DUF924 domain-containing protein [Cyanothece sp. SIO1E1]|nr:DUF924 domain-containing protein [Cyanothece sp. SIO1E1]
MKRITAILNFWFGDPQDIAGTHGQPRKIWFSKKTKFDAEIKARFQADYAQAATGQLDHWQIAPDSCLALILLLDQFPRHMFRGTPEAFTTDAKALTVAQMAIAQNFDQQLRPIQRIFFYYPLEHSENLEHQHQAVELLRSLCTHHINAPTIPKLIPKAITLCTSAGRSS